MLNKSPIKIQKLHFVWRGKKQRARFTDTQTSDLRWSSHLGYFDSSLCGCLNE